MSSTVLKAMTLLDIFSEAEPEIGLSDMARKAGMDKATAHRMLTVMMDVGFVEQRSDTRLYRLGAGILRLARIREASFPVSAVVETALAELSKITGETAHASLISGRNLATIAVCESARAIHVSLIAGEMLPFHSTASGLVTLAFGSKDLRERALSKTLARLTPQTVTDVPTLRQLIAEAKGQGYAEANQTNEDAVYGMAAPIFDAGGEAAGAIAVATPFNRMTPELRETIRHAVIGAAIGVTEKTGGSVPAAYRAFTAQ